MEVDDQQVNLTRFSLFFPEKRLFFQERASSSFVQYNNAADVFAGNFRLQYNPREGNDFYLVFSENLNTDRMPGNRFDPLLPVSNGRTLLLKYRHTFVL